MGDQAIMVQVGDVYVFQVKKSPSVTGYYDNLGYALSKLMYWCIEHELKKVILEHVDGITMVEYDFYGGDDGR